MRGGGGASGFFCLFVFVLLRLLSRQTFCLQSIKGCDEISRWKHLSVLALRVSRLCQSLTCATAWLNTDVRDSRKILV